MDSCGPLSLRSREAQEGGRFVALGAYNPMCLEASEKIWEEQDRAQVVLVGLFAWMLVWITLPLALA